MIDNTIFIVAKVTAPVATIFAIAETLDGNWITGGGMTVLAGVLIMVIRSQNDERREWRISIDSMTKQIAEGQKEISSLLREALGMRRKDHE